MHGNILKLSTALKIDANDRWHSLNLNASENYTSLLVKKIVGLHPAYDSYHFAPQRETKEGHWSFIETSFIKKLRKYIEAQAEELLGTPFIDPRPKGGQCAEIAALLGVAQRGDIVFYVSENDGGHFGMSQMAKISGIHLEPVVFNHTSHLIDVDTTLQRMRDIRGSQYGNGSGGHIKAVIIAQSFVLRRQNIRDLCAKIRNEFPDIIISWDVSHTFGLVIGQQYPNPLEEGAHILQANTHKTFPGPQKAIMAFHPHIEHGIIDQVSAVICPLLQSNCGTGEILALAVAFEEMQMHGKEYAKEVCKNAQAIAVALKKQGLSVIGEHFGFTETHQVWFSVEGKQAALEGFRLLHLAGIRLNPVILPFTGNRWGMRLGSAALTRRGFSATEMQEIAKIIRRVLIDKKDPVKLRNDTRELIGHHPLNHLHYVLDNQQQKFITSFLENMYEPIPVG